MKQKQLLLLLALLMTAATGAVAQTGMTKGLFSVSATKRVHFSKGNLQYDGTNWKFAASQWEVLGANGTGANGTATNYPMDLFTWGNIDSPTYNGTTYYTENADLSGITDWGSRMGFGWRTLSSAEWTYLFNTRTVNGGTGSGKSYTLGQSVNNKLGVVIYPDNYTGEVYSGSDWATFESAGCVFLPIAGLRGVGGGAKINSVGARGCYWSSTNNNDNHAYYVNFNTGEVSPQTVSNRVYGLSVRLVIDEYVLTLADGTQDAKNWTITSGEKSATGDEPDGLKGISENDAVTLTYGGRLKVKSVTATTDAAPATPAIDYSTAQLGDLFYSDGTFSTTLEAGKTPIGVIAYLDQEGTNDDEITEKSNGAGHGLVLCLKNAASGAAAQWSTEKSAFEFGEDAKVADVDALKRTTNVSGYTNTKTLAEKTDAATKYKAAYAAKNYTGLTAPTGTTGWFLPSAQQWVKMQTGLGALEESVFTWNSWFDNSHTAADKWEAALSKAGSGNYDSMTSAYLFCWSSSEYSENQAVGLYVGAQGTGSIYGFRWLFRTKDSDSDGNRVRPVLAF